MKNRIISVDIFRGLTIVLMVLVNTPGTWSHVYPPFLHAPWHGYTPTDLVFPFFLFIVGTSIVFSYKNRSVTAYTYRKIAIRAIKLIGLGLFLGAFTLSFPFVKDFADIRFPGVLQRIGIVFFFTSLIFINCSLRTVVGIFVFLLVGYWLLMGFVPVEGVPSTFDRAPNNVANYIDLKILGSHMWKDDYDPEGILSTIPAIASALLGVFTGCILTSRQPKKATILFGLGGLLLLVGHLWDSVFPINKALWSSSFVLVTGGWANIFLALIYYITDARGMAFGSVFRYAGANAIVLYFLSSFIGKSMALLKVGDRSLHSWIFENFFVNDWFSMKLSSLLYALCVVGFYMFLAFILYRKKIFIKV